MKLLIITQKVNKQDPVLGFFHEWISEFSKGFENITTICLEKGEASLPENVQVFSLGKEGGESRLKYILNFYKFIFLNIKNFDSVLVHMNQEYVLLGGVFWKIFGKKIYMWRNHHAGSLLTDIASMFCTKVFCTSKFSYTSKYKKTVLMPVGIDTEKFKIQNSKFKIPRSILFLGRIAPVKKPDVFLKTLSILKNRGVGFTASIYGDPLPKDINYYTSLISYVKENDLTENVKFERGVSNKETVSIYNSNEVFVNLSSSGMYDKTIFEAMACETIVVATNRNLEGVIDPCFVAKEDNAMDIAEKIENLLNMNTVNKLRFGKELRTLTNKEHSLKALGQKLVFEMS